MNLDELRDELSAVDRRLLEVIAERQRLVGEIGRNKLSTGRATRDYEREKEVLETARAQAEKLGIDPKVAEGVVGALIRTSLASQERARVAAEGKGNGRRVLVIGGAGKMGGWFAEFFTSQGFTTSIADARTEPGEGSFRDWRDAGTDYDVIVVATPLAVSGGIYSELLELQHSTDRDDKKRLLRYDIIS